MQIDDWRGEHLIRTAKNPDPQENISPSGHARKQAIYAAARKTDAEAIRQLAKDHTRVEIQQLTGLSLNRVYFICTTFKIAPMERKCAPKKRG